MENTETIQVPLLIDGEEISTDITFDVINPNDNDVIWRASGSSNSHAFNAVQSAQNAFSQWAKSLPTVRRDLFLRAAELFKHRRRELASYMKLETGAADAFINFNLDTGREMLLDIAGRITSIQGFVPSTAEDSRSALVVKEPFGVVLGIAPWNAPYILGVRAMAFALAAGNTVVLKGSELSPRCFWAIGDIFHQAGLPTGCLNVLYHRPQDAAEVTQALISHPAVKKVNFTGSTAVGSIIASTAGKFLKPVLLELGGKASAIVLSDANVQAAAFQCALGSFLHSGQVCMGTERIIVHKEIIAEFSKAIKAATAEVFGSSPQPLTLATKLGVEKNRKLVADAVSKGASVLYGDPEAIYERPNWLHPVILRNVSKDMEIYYTESFGPVVVLYTFETEEQAISLANDTEYGLTGAVFTANLATGLRVAKALETGAVHINGMTIHDEPNLPHGGAKNSGFGRFNSTHGLDEFLRTKTITWQD